MSRKILLIIPPNIVLKNSIRRIGEPIGVISIATYLASMNYEPHVFDMTLEGYDTCVYEGDHVIYGSSQESLLEKLEEVRPDVVGISSMFSSKEALTLQVAKTCKRFSRALPVILGGMPPTITPELYLKTGDVDYVVLHDGEIRMEKLIRALAEGKRPEEVVDGIALCKDGKLVSTPPGRLNQFFSTLPFPDRRWVKMDEYIKIGKPYAPYNNGRRTGHIVATKGCPFDCIFCSAVHFVGKKVHKRSIENVLEEVDQLTHCYGVQEIQFMDDNLTLDKAHAMRLFAALEKYNLKWCTPNGLYLNSLDDELLGAMAASGCYQITLAIESSSPRVLREVIRKKVNLDAVPGIVAKAHELGLMAHSLFVVGLPGETLDEIRETLAFPKKAGFDSVSFSVANAFPGSRLFSLCRERNYEIVDPKSVNYRGSNFIVPESSPDYVISRSELEKLVAETTESFFIWSKETFPEIFRKKYQPYLERNVDAETVITSRL